MSSQGKDPFKWNFMFFMIKSILLSTMKCGCFTKSIYTSSDIVPCEWNITPIHILKWKKYHKMANTFLKLMKAFGENSEFCGLFILSSYLLPPVLPYSVLERDFGRAGCPTHPEDDQSQVLRHLACSVQVSRVLQPPLAMSLSQWLWADDKIRVALQHLQSSWGKLCPFHRKMNIHRKVNIYLSSHEAYWLK